MPVKKRTNELILLIEKTEIFLLISVFLHIIKAILRQHKKES